MSIYEISNFLTDDECAKYIKQINDKQRVVAFTDSSDAKTDKYIDPVLANEFYERICGMINIEGITGSNQLIMTSSYQPGQSFGIHSDTGLYYNSADRIKTSHTVLIYLNDDYEGGNTVFYDDYFKVSKIITPVKGKCLIFDISLFHEGKQVIEGKKYWIGCELIGPF